MSAQQNSLSEKSPRHAAPSPLPFTVLGHGNYVLMPISYCLSSYNFMLRSSIGIASIHQPVDFLPAPDAHALREALTYANMMTSGPNPTFFASTAQALSPPTPAPHTPVDTLRGRVKVTCENCYIARKKCDHARPCAPCVMKGKGETCIDHVRKGKGKTCINHVRKGKGKTCINHVRKSARNVEAPAASTSTAGFDHMYNMYTADLNHNLAVGIGYAANEQTAPGAGGFVPPPQMDFCDVNQFSYGQS